MSDILSPNSTIAQYTIVSKIGAGGMEVCARAIPNSAATSLSKFSLLPSTNALSSTTNRFKSSHKVFVMEACCPMTGITSFDVYLNGQLFVNVALCTLAHGKGVILKADE